MSGYLINDFVFDEFRYLFEIEPRIRYVLILYVVLISLGVFGAYIFAKRPIAVSAIVVAAGAVAAMESVTLAWPIIESKTPSANVVEASADKLGAPITIQASALSPNVYLVLPDMMIGAKFFQEYGLDTKIFSDLEERGYTVIYDAQANAPVTSFSTMHLFGMRYFLKDGERLNARRLQALGNLAGPGNSAYEGFRARGYKIIALNDGYISGCGRGEDTCIEKPTTTILTLQDFRFFERTPFFEALNVADMKFNLFQIPINLWAYPARWEVPEFIGKLPDPASGPFLMYMHLGLPHDPYRFDQDCTYRRFDDTKVLYSKQAQCAIKMFGILVDEIKRNDPNAIVIIQADHGIPPFTALKHKTIDELTDQEIRRSFNIFSAYHLPPHCRNYLRPGLSPVNTFRVVFGCIDNREPALLEDRSFLVFYLSWPEGGKVKEWRRKPEFPKTD